MSMLFGLWGSRAFFWWFPAGEVTGLVVARFHVEAGSRPGWRVTFLCYAKET